MSSDRIQSLRIQLQGLYNDPETNKDAIANLISEIRDLELAELTKLKEEAVKKDTKLASLDIDSEELWLKIYKDKGIISEHEAGDKGLFSVGNLTNPISKDQWYNTDQVACLTKEKVPAGSKELTSFLKETKLPAHFSHLQMPNSKDPSLNHFVAYSISNVGGKIKVTYCDPNGELMPQASKDAIEKAYGSKVDIVYRDKDGKEMSEETAKSQPQNILRVQHDGNSCGAYSALLVNSLKEGGQDIAAIKNVDISKIRAEHQKHMDDPKQRDQAIGNNIVTKCQKGLAEIKETLQEHNVTVKEPSSIGGVANNINRNDAGISR